jgi:hypothetical protein
LPETAAFDSPFFPTNSSLGAFSDASFHRRRWCASANQGPQTSSALANRFCSARRSAWQGSCLFLRRIWPPISSLRGVGICRSALPSGYVGYFGRLALNTCHQELFAASGSLCDARHELRRSDGFHLRGLKKRIFAQKRNSLCVHRMAEVRDCRCFKPIEPPIFQSSKRRRSQARLLTSDSPQERGLS